MSLPARAILIPADPPHRPDHQPPSFTTSDQEMASRHRARFRSIQVIRVAEVKSSEVRRAYMKQLVEPGLKFPLPHRVLRAPSRRFKSLFMGQRPTTFF